MGKWYRVRVRARVRDRARAREHSSSFLFFSFFFSTPKFAYVVTICNFEFCYQRRAIHTPDQEVAVAVRGSVLSLDPRNGSD